MAQKSANELFDTGYKWYAGFTWYCLQKDGPEPTGDNFIAQQLKLARQLTMQLESGGFSAFSSNTRFYSIKDESNQEA